MDTTKIEYTAEDLISHRLQRSGILVAKPKFDREGTDLLAFIEMNNGVKLCRIQCKGRTLLNSKNSHIEIKKEYVTEAFIVFLYVEEGIFNESNLYCFFSTDIEQWHSTNGNYVLNIPKSFKSKLKFYEFNISKVKLIKDVIKRAQ